MQIIDRQSLDVLFDVLKQRGYQLVGPTVRDGAIVYAELSSPADLPAGWTDEQDGGTYRLKRRTDEALFGYAVGPHSWKKFLFPPVLKLFSASRTNQGFEIIPPEAVGAHREPPSPALPPQRVRSEKAGEGRGEGAAPLREPPLQPNPQSAIRNPQFAFIGVRSCELHAIAIQDRVFMSGAYVDPTYKLRREKAFIVAVNCGQAGGTCFCVSMNTGPGVSQIACPLPRPPGTGDSRGAGGGRGREARKSQIAGDTRHTIRDTRFDLALTEVLDSNQHYFVVEVGSEQGTAVMREVPHREATAEEVEVAERIVAQTATQMGRTLDTTGIKDLLYRNYEHPRWDDVATRCLTCANCTLVCPTCFCTTVEDVTDLAGEHAERWRKWDSCFTLDFSYIHGGSVRSSTRARYRQWMTHKLATWIDQFGTSGCVGCGRCITWCPVAIDITEEVRAIRESQKERNDAIT